RRRGCLADLAAAPARRTTPTRAVRGAGRAPPPRTRPVTAAATDRSPVSVAAMADAAGLPAAGAPTCFATRTRSRWFRAAELTGDVLVVCQKPCSATALYRRLVPRNRSSESA